MTKDILSKPCWLLDLDGTLVDSSVGVVRAFHAAQAAFHEAPADAARIRAAIGYPLPETVAQLSRIAYKEFFPHFYQEAETNMHFHSVLLPGAERLLKLLAKRGRRIALVTSKRSDNARRILDHLGVLDHFALLVGDECTPHNKPSPEPILFALTELGVPATDAVMVGDTRADIESARAAAVPVIAACGGTDPRERLADADLCVEGATGLVQLLANHSP